MQNYLSFNPYPIKSSIATVLEEKGSPTIILFQSLPDKIINCNNKNTSRMRDGCMGFNLYPIKSSIVTEELNWQPCMRYSFNPYPIKSSIATILSDVYMEVNSFNPYPIKSSIATYIQYTLSLVRIVVSIPTRYNHQLQPQSWWLSGTGSLSFNPYPIKSSIATMELIFRGEP